MKQKWQLVCIFFLILIAGQSCYIGPDVQYWDLDEDDASAKIGMPLFIVPAAEWVSYTATQNLQGLNNHYRVYEGLWNNRPNEWIIYRRTETPSGTNIIITYHMFRIFTNDFSSRDFDTISEAEEAMNAVPGSLSAVSWNTPPSNIVPPLSKNYRVYNCVWRNETREWVIIRESNTGIYEWYRIDY